MPITIVLGFLYLALSPVVAFVAIAADIARGRRDLPWSRASVAIGLYAACELLGIGASFALWIATGGGRLVGERRWLEANAALQAAWCSAIFGGLTRIYSMNVHVTGAPVPDGPVLAVVRHSSVADTVLTAALVANPAGLRLRYVLKAELLFDPCLDIVGSRLPNAFISRKTQRRGEDIQQILNLVDGIGAGSGVLIYPEGTHYKPKRLERATERLAKRGKTKLAELAGQLTSTLPPKTGGALALMNAAPDATILFVEHHGLEVAQGFGALLNGGLTRQTISVRLRSVPVSSVPAEDRDVWLFERWIEMDRWICDAAERTR